METIDDQYTRIEKIIGSFEKPFEKTIEIYEEYLNKSLDLPCKITGIEDFNWEEVYVWGGGSQEEYKKLKKNQPSYEDKYELISIDKNISSRWMICKYEIAAMVKRISDGNMFYLGLSEIEAVDKKSLNYQLLNDYSVWFCNR
jgi:hypothetical protein